MIIINSNTSNPYEQNSEYQQTHVEYDYEYRGIIYYQKLTYEKQISLISRIGLGILALLAIVTVIPSWLYSNKIAVWLQHAIKGVDQRIVLIAEAPKHGSPALKNTQKPNRHAGKSQVRFGHAEICVFDKKEPPVDIQKRANQKPIKTLAPFLQTVAT